MSEIKVKCIDQILMIEDSPDIASGDVSIDRISFSFCKEWDGYTKAGVFYNDPNKTYPVLLDENNSVIIPGEVMKSQTLLYFGVIGVKDDKIRTSNVVRYRILKGPMDGTEWLENPEPNIFLQLMSKYTAILDQLSLIQTLTVDEVDEICNGTYAEILDDTNLSPIVEFDEISVDDVADICK